MFSYYKFIRKKLGCFRNRLSK